MPADGNDPVSAPAAEDPGRRDPIPKRPGLPGRPPAPPRQAARSASAAEGLRQDDEAHAAYSAAMTGRRPRAVFIALATATGILVSAHSAVAALNFFPARSFTAGGLPFDIVAGDLDHDGIADLATTDESGGKVFVLRGNGDGTFQAAQGYTTGAGAEGITLANLRVLFPDQRPELDIVAANLNAGTLSV